MDIFFALSKLSKRKTTDIIRGLNFLKIGFYLSFEQPNIIFEFAYAWKLKILIGKKSSNKHLYNFVLWELRHEIEMLAIHNKLY